MEFSIGTSELQKIIRMLGVVVKSNSTDFTGRILYLIQLFSSRR
jgi:hypothetical protein